MNLSHESGFKRWNYGNLEENDMKMLVGIFSNALYTYAPNVCTKLYAA